MPLHQPNIDLLKGVIENNEQAIHHLFRLYYSSLGYYAQSLVQQQQEAEDIAIDAFLKFLQRKEQFQTLAAVKSFLFTTVKNACIDYLRKEKRHQQAHAEIVHIEQAPAAEDTLEITAMVLQSVYEEIENLPTQCKLVFKALFYEGKKTNVVAEELGLSPQTVLNQKAKAIKHLQWFLQQKGYMDTLLWGTISLQAYLLHQFHPPLQ
ncbi:hypothetical protein CK934_20975 [Chitinophaga sp. MD30]|nr:hypothetical protein CK934_20975 [Chitinophaga sp. MD30]